MVPPGHGASGLIIGYSDKPVRKMNEMIVDAGALLISRFLGTWAVRCMGLLSCDGEVCM